MSKLSITQNELKRMKGEALVAFCKKHGIEYDESKLDVRGHLGYLRNLISDHVGGFRRGRPKTGPVSKKPRVNAAEPVAVVAPNIPTSAAKNKEESMKAMIQKNICDHLDAAKNIIDAISLHDPHLKFIFTSKMSGQCEFLLRFVDRVYLHPAFIAWQQNAGDAGEGPLALSMRRLVDQDEPLLTRDFWKETLRGGQVIKTIALKQRLGCNADRKWLHPVLQVTNVRKFNVKEIMTEDVVKSSDIHVAAQSGKRKRKPVSQPHVCYTYDVTCSLRDQGNVVGPAIFAPEAVSDAVTLLHSGSVIMLTSFSIVPVVIKLNPTYVRPHIIVTGFKLLKSWVGEPYRLNCVVDLVGEMLPDDTGATSSDATASTSVTGVNPSGTTSNCATSSDDTASTSVTGVNPSGTTSNCATSSGDTASASVAGASQSDTTNAPRLHTGTSSSENVNDESDGSGSDTASIVDTIELDTNIVIASQLHEKYEKLCYVTGDRADTELNVPYRCNGSTCSIGCINTDVCLALLHNPSELNIEAIAAKYPYHVSESLSNRNKRALLYWRFSKVIFKGLTGYRKRHRLPECVVLKIRETYPNEKGTAYVGFEEADDDENHFAEDDQNGQIDDAEGATTDVYAAYCR